jgi:histidinol-phosphate phosphatase family protein
MNRAVFLDRDGTLIEHVHHLRTPEDVVLIPGSGQAIRDLRAAGYLCVVVTNQSVVGRGLLDEAGLAKVHEALSGLLLREGTCLDGLYYCPAVPVSGSQTLIEDFQRKPGPGMLLRAAQELEISLGDSWMIGDSLSDLEAGRNAGCRESLLVLTGFGEITCRCHRHDCRAFPTLVDAAQAILGAA